MAAEGFHGNRGLVLRARASDFRLSLPSPRRTPSQGYEITSTKVFAGTTTTNTDNGRPLLRRAQQVTTAESSRITVRRRRWSADLGHFGLFLEVAMR